MKTPTKEVKCCDPSPDPVNQPTHYKFPGGVEVIQLTRHLNFNRGNAVKYLCRAGQKDPAKELEDLRKAEFYVKDEIKRLEDAKK